MAELVSQRPRLTVAVHSNLKWCHAQWQWLAPCVALKLPLRLHPGAAALQWHWQLSQAPFCLCSPHQAYMVVVRLRVK